MSAPHHRRRATALTMGAVSLGVLLALGGPALAQDQEPAPEPPAADPAETAEESDGGAGIDLTGVVQVDDEGNIIWNVDADTVDADAVVEPTAIPEPVVADDPEPAPALEPAVQDDDRSFETTAGTGNGLMLVLAVAAGAVVLGLGGMSFVRHRSQRRDDLDRVEEVVVDPQAGESFIGGFAEPEYAGATDAGAYEEGGAAYAQYTEPNYDAAGAADLDNGPSRSRLDQIRASMTDLADKRLQDSGKAHIVAKKLEAAGSKMRPGEWLLMAIAVTLGAFAGATFVFGLILGVAAAALGVFASWSYLSYREGKRQRQFAEDLPETLQLIAGSLRGGTSMIQAIDTVADEADEPTASEFQRLMTESRLGRDLAVSFRDLSERMDSKDFEWVVTAIEIHREVGGDLASILDRVSDTIRARNRVRGQVKALSAEGKMSGALLFMLPPGMVGAISVLNREYLNEMVDTSEGQIMLVVAGVLLVIGGAWLKRLSRFVY